LTKASARNLLSSLKCAETHLQQSIISKLFRGLIPEPPYNKGRRGKAREGEGRAGRGVEGRDKGCPPASGQLLAIAWLRACSDELPETRDHVTLYQL